MLLIETGTVGRQTSFGVSSALEMLFQVPARKSRHKAIGKIRWGVCSVFEMQM